MYLKCYSKNNKNNKNTDFSAIIIKLFCLYNFYFRYFFDKLPLPQPLHLPHHHIKGDDYCEDIGYRERYPNSV